MLGTQYTDMISSLPMNRYLLYAKPSDDAFMLVGKHNEEKRGGGDMGT